MEHTLFMIEISVRDTIYLSGSLLALFFIPKNIFFKERSHEL